MKPGLLYSRYYIQLDKDVAEKVFSTGELWERTRSIKAFNIDYVTHDDWVRYSVFMADDNEETHQQMIDIVQEFVDESR